MSVSIEVSREMQKMTKVSLIVLLNSNSTSENLKRTVELKNGLENEESSVQILVAKDAILSPWFKNQKTLYALVSKS